MTYPEMKADLLERLYRFSSWIMEKPGSFDAEHFALLPALLKIFFEYENDADCRKSPESPGSLPEITN